MPRFLLPGDPVPVEIAALGRSADEGGGTETAQEVDVDGLSEAVDAEGVEGTDWLTAGGIVVGTVLVAIVVRMALRRIFRRAGADGFATDLVARMAVLVVGVTGLTYALAVLGVRVGPRLGALGIAGIVLAFALKDVLENFVAGVLLQLRRPFDRGDQIISGDYDGTVIGIDSRAVVIDTPDGRQVTIPSSALITGDIVNLTAHVARRTTLEVGVAYATDLDRAQEVLAGAAQAVDGVRADPAAEALVMEFGDSSIVFAVRYWHTPTIAEMWRVRDAVARSIRTALAAEGIEIPFPQRVVSFPER